MPTLSISHFLRGRKKAYEHWRERCDRKETELSVLSKRAYMKGTEESQRAHLSKLRESKRDYEKTIEQRLKDAEDLKIMREQNREWMIEAERKLMRIQERINRAQLQRVADARVGRHHMLKDGRR